MRPLCGQHDAAFVTNSGGHHVMFEPGRDKVFKRLSSLRCRSASRLPGSRYASDMSQPGPMNLKSLRHEN